MPAPIELALSTLLPTVSFLPPELISLAQSLLAQSRSKAPNLRPEEEIARTFACAHIACERLAKKLDLEISSGKDVRAPAKPSVYQKLKVFLNGVLLGGGGGRGGGGEGRRTPRKEVAARATPKKQTLDAQTPNVTTTSGRKRMREEVEEEEENKGLGFVLPMIRALCRASGTPAAVPHVNVGAKAVVEEIVSRTRTKNVASASGSKRRRTTTPRSAGKARTTANTDDEVTFPVERWPALLVSLHGLTVAKMKDLEVSDQEMQKIRTEDAKAVRSFCDERIDTLPNNFNARLDKLDADIDFYLLEAEDCGWLEMEWFANVPVSKQDTPDDEEQETFGSEEEAATFRKRTRRVRRKNSGEDVGAAGLLSGSGTMFQPAVDWLSDERRADYARWKKGILEEIAAIERAV